MGELNQKEVKNKQIEIRRFVNIIKVKNGILQIRLSKIINEQNFKILIKQNEQKIKKYKH
jgi:hypothetical protein